MKIVKWLSPSMSCINGHALIRVEADEIADADKMLILVDGDSVGHFGYTIKLISVGEEMPKIKSAKYRGKLIGIGYYEADEDFGFPNSSKIKSSVRYYDCFVRRD